MNFVLSAIRRRGKGTGYMRRQFLAESGQRAASAATIEMLGDYLIATLIATAFGPLRSHLNEGLGETAARDTAA